MSKAINLTGKIFTRLTVIKRAKNSKGNKARWECKCTCGKTVIVSAASLKSKHESTKSCGCLQKENYKKFGGVKTHGMSNTDEYNSWEHIVQRCTNPNNTSFHNYGARGITICSEWRNDFMAFFNYIGPKPSKNHSVDRINNNSGYKPGNVRWATQTQQANNSRHNRKITVSNVTLTVAEWARFVGINQATLWYRILAGWPKEKAIFSSVKTQYRSHKTS
jgi:hypothetical protein